LKTEVRNCFFIFPYSEGYGLSSTHSSATSVSTSGAPNNIIGGSCQVFQKRGFIMFNEVQSFHGQTLLLVTKPSLQATALLQHLKQSLTLSGKLHSIQRSFDDITPGSIILFDMMEADKKLIQYWQDILSRKNNNIRVLLLNTPEEYPFRDIESWPHINGVFYVNEDEARVVDGLQGVLRGECYFSQKLASYLITHSGNYRYNSSESALLTHREKEILNKLRIGASNIEIARSLFISENTVKTHLYNLFKKIAVKNRTQAVSWANDNLRR